MTDITECSYCGTYTPFDAWEKDICPDCRRKKYKQNKHTPCVRLDSKEADNVKISEPKEQTINWDVDVYEMKNIDTRNGEILLIKKETNK